jgi:hypothetical protein
MKRQAARGSPEYGQFACFFAFRAAKGRKAVESAKD